MPWGKSAGATHAGEDIGCELALRHSKDGTAEVYIKSIAAGGPAALTGQLAVGDVIAEINGLDPFDESSGAVKSLHKLLEGDMGAPVWLKTRGDSRPHVTLIRQEPLSLSASKGLAGLGFSFKGEKTVDSSSVEIFVTEVKPGGAFWLQAQSGGTPVVVGDVITHVDGVATDGGSAVFKGAPFTRLTLMGRKADGEAFECTIVRMHPLPEKLLSKVEEYKKAVECIPPAPPIDRVNANSEIQTMAAPLIYGLNIKAAAKVISAINTPTMTNERAHGLLGTDKRHSPFCRTVCQH